MTYYLHKITKLYNRRLLHYNFKWEDCTQIDFRLYMRFGLLFRLCGPHRMCVLKIWFTFPSFLRVQETYDRFNLKVLTFYLVIL